MVFWEFTHSWKPDEDRKEWWSWQRLLWKQNLSHTGTWSSVCPHDKLFLTSCRKPGPGTWGLALRRVHRQPYAPPLLTAPVPGSSLLYGVFQLVWCWHLPIHQRLWASEGSAARLMPKRDNGNSEKTHSGPQHWGRAESARKSMHGFRRCSEHIKSSFLLLLKTPMELKGTSVWLISKGSL